MSAAPRPRREKQLIEKVQRAPRHDDPALPGRRVEKANANAANTSRRGERDRLKREADVRQKAEDDARVLAEASAAKTKSRRSGKKLCRGNG